MTYTTIHRKYLGPKDKFNNSLENLEWVRHNDSVTSAWPVGVDMYHIIDQKEKGGVMNVNEHKMLIELLREASNTFEEFELNIGTCEGYRYALKDELLGYAIMLEEILKVSTE